jgi:hypothetical protein
MMALSATSRDGVMLQGGRPMLQGTAPQLVGFRGMTSLMGVGATALMGLGADGDVIVPPAGGASTTTTPSPAALNPTGTTLLALLVGAAVTTGVTSWMFSASRDGSNVKPGLVAGGTYLAGGLLMVLLAKSAV